MFEGKGKIFQGPLQELTGEREDLGDTKRAAGMADELEWWGNLQEHE